MDIPYSNEAEFLAARAYDAYLADLARQAKAKVGATGTAPTIARSVEEQLKQAQTEAARLREELRKAKKKRKSSEWKPDYPGQHRGY